MRDAEITIRPRLECAVIGHCMAVANGFEVAVKSPGFCGHHEMRREVDASAKPPRPIVEGEVPHIHVDDGHMGIAWMQNTRNTCCRKTCSSGVQLLGKCRRHCPFHSRIVEPSFLDDPALFEDAGIPSSSISALPMVACE